MADLCCQRTLFALLPAPPNHIMHAYTHACINDFAFFGVLPALSAMNDLSPTIQGCPFVGTSLEKLLPACSNENECMRFGVQVNGSPSLMVDTSNGAQLKVAEYVV